MDMKILSDNGYTTKFHPYDVGVTFYNTDVIKIIVTKEAFLQEWWDENGLWYIPLDMKIMNITNDTIAINGPVQNHAIHNLYEFSSTDKAMCYLHVVLDFPKKVTDQNSQ